MMFSSVVSVYAKGPQQWSDISKDILSKELGAMNERFSRMLNYTVNVTDESFATYTASIYHEKFSGYFKRDRENFHSYLGSVHTIQNNECRVAVDSIKKMILISDPVDYLDQVLKASDYISLLKVCSKMRVSHADNKTTYRLDFVSGYPMAAYELTINKDSLPEKIIIYYNKEVKGTNENVSAKPRMEIYFENWATKPVTSKSDFSIDKYLIKQGDKYALKPAYSAQYKLLDERVLTRNNKK
jgi:hypothetical protein